MNFRVTDMIRLGDGSARIPLPVAEFGLTPIYLFAI